MYRHPEPRPPRSSGTVSSPDAIRLSPDQARAVTGKYLPDHDRRMAVAREVAAWHLGDPSWAGLIVGAYLNPDEAQQELDMERDEP